MTLLPELYMLLFAVSFLFLSLGKKKAPVFAAAKALALLGFALTLACSGARGELFSGAYRVDFFSQVFKVLLSAGFTLVVFMFEKEDEVENLPEYFMFLGFSTLGLMILVSSVELISIVISLEISSFSLYAVVPLRKAQTKTQLEAAMKYLFFGAIATGIMLYGMGYLYGMAHSTYLADVAAKLPQFLAQPLGVLALILALTAFFFKLSLFPMHFWAPDIYEGASDATTTFIATIPKIAATALLIRLTMLASSNPGQLATIIIVLAALSMTLGNLVGLVQKDMKRLLAYSGIAHAGYLMMGLLSFNRDGNAAVVYYIVVYLFMNLACFYVVMLLSRRGENVSISDLSGLSRRSPLLAFTLAVAAFSLAGIPPTGGFTGKFFLFVSAFEAGYLAIVLIAAVNTVISVFYYLNLVRVSYSREAEDRQPLQLALHEKVLCYVFNVIILFTGLMPHGLLDLFRRAM
ncbi:MAG: NADH-quinone oxidoreductase subunit N [Proteobacteria bacterium]|nr:NADH-quinone oxidoreductase subunit N [Pseudomonadota bacterium]